MGKEFRAVLKENDLPYAPLSPGEFNRLRDALLMYPSSPTDCFIPDCENLPYFNLYLRNQDGQKLSDPRTEKKACKKHRNMAELVLSIVIDDTDFFTVCTELLSEASPRLTI